MKKLLIGLFVLFAAGVFVSVQAVEVKNVSDEPNSCTKSESEDLYYYLTDNSFYTNPFDVLKTTKNNLIVYSDGSVVEVWRNGIISGCQSRGRVSTVAVPWEKEWVRVLVNTDNCFFNIPSYTKTKNPTAIDAKIHYIVGYAEINDSWKHEGSWKLYYKAKPEWSKWKCYPSGKVVNSYQDCDKVSVKYWDKKQHIWECLNYRVFWCGDGIVNSITWNTYNNGTFTEECDPEAPEWKNRSDWKTCSSTCQIIESQNPVCSSAYNGKTQYTTSSSQWLKSTDNKLCDQWSVKDFSYSAWVYTWKCQKWTSSVSCTAKQERCGDGVRNGWEQCDYNDKNEVNWWNDGCSTLCEKKIQQNSGKCDDTFYRTLRHWWEYTFYDKFIPSGTRYLYDFDVKFEEEKPFDFNGWQNPTFHWLSNLGNGVYKKVSSTKEVIESEPPYQIINHPDVRSKNNLYIEYNIKYSDKAYSSKPDDSKLKTHKECVYYEISRCGDGVLDTEYGEECDPGSESTKVWPNWQVCNSECKFGSKWHLVIEKTLKWSSWVVNAWDTITWSLKITASWWDVKDFIVTDKLPEVLAFDSYSIPNPVWLTVSNPITSWNEVKWNVKWTLEEWKYLEIIVNTKAKWMPEKDYVNVACVAPADNPTEEDCDDKPLPSVWVLDIKKTLISKDKYVTHLWQELEWKIVVRAINGYTWINRIEDKLPEELNYKSSEVVHTPKGINIEKEKVSDDNRSVMWPAKWILLSWEYIEIHLTSEVVKMPNPNKQVVNVACVKPMTWEELCDTWHVSNVWIQKFVLDANGKEQKAITWSVWDTITYKVHFGNNGDEPVIVGLKDFLPKWVKFVSWELVVSNNGRGWSLSTWSFDMKYEWNQIKIDWVEINKYEKVHLNPNESWVLTIVGTILEPGDKSENRTNFACIYDENDNVIDCDDAHHNVGGILCKSNIEKDNSYNICDSSKSWTVPVVCESDGWIADEIEIFCDGKSLKLGTRTSKLTWDCVFSEEWQHTAQCKINWSTWAVNNCEGIYKLTRNCWTPPPTPPTPPNWRTPYCDNMDVDRNHNTVTCKATSNAYFKVKWCKKNGSYTQTSDEKDTEWEFECDSISSDVACTVNASKNGFDFEDPSRTCKEESEDYCKNNKDDPICELAKQECFNVNVWNFSIEKWEILPFYFNIEREEGVSIKFASSNETCSSEKAWAIDLSSLKCSYVIRNPHNDNVFSESNIDCLIMGDFDIKWNSLIDKWAEQQKKDYDIDPFVDNMGVSYWPNIKWTDSTRWNTDDIFWEYKFQLKVDEYKYCSGTTNTWERVERDRPVVCQSNFVLTTPYTVQKTPSWNLKASTTVLDKFKRVDGSDIISFSSYLNAIATSEYHPNQKVNDAMNAFIKKYEKLAVKVNPSRGSFLSWINIKKVPWKNIYFIEWDVTINWWNRNITNPFTIVQKGWNGTVTINWNVSHNMMILTEWNIKFKSNCTTTQKVKWIFYAKKNLGREWVWKNTINGTEWCTQWWLNVQWVLIWNDFNNLMKSSRSHLENWFKTEDGGKKWEIMKGWSVVIEYSPSIFTKSTMPPGAEDFTTALSIYRN